MMNKKQKEVFDLVYKFYKDEYVACTNLKMLVNQNFNKESPYNLGELFSLVVIMLEVRADGGNEIINLLQRAREVLNVGTNENRHNKQSINDTR